jgi:hypothetical protein
MPQMPGRLRRSHQSFLEPQPAAALDCLRGLLDATVSPPFSASEKRVWMSFLDQKGLGLLVQGRAS